MSNGNPLSPQRFLANNRNALLSAVLTPSVVQTVASQVNEIPTARSGKAKLSLTGDYSGTEAATYDFQIMDASVATQLLSTPISSGVGSGLLANLVATGPAQQFTVQLVDEGLPTTTSSVDFEGVKIVSRTPGAGGNAINISVDQSTLVFVPTSYSLLNDLDIGAGSDTTALTGAGYFWDTKQLGADGAIPTAAHRIAFGDDTSQIYLQYRVYKPGQITGSSDGYGYYFVPAIQRVIPAGTKVVFVTGGRTVTLSDGVHSDETYTDVETDFDILNDINTTSVMCMVDGIVALDRTPTGQASREFSVRTDARPLPSSGTGSSFATGFDSVFVNSGAATELITATCFATNASVAPFAHLGHEQWKLRGSVSGDLGEIYTGEPYVDPSGNFGLTIPIRLPLTAGLKTGAFTAGNPLYVSRAAGVENPPICPVALDLGPNATDGSILLTYTKRPSGACACGSLPVPDLDTACLGNIDGGSEAMAYKPANVARLTTLYNWYAELVRSNTVQSKGAQNADQAPLLTNPKVAHQVDSTLDPSAIDGSQDKFVPNNGGSSIYVNYTPIDTVSLKQMIKNFEMALAELDPLDETITAVGNAITAWETAVAEMEGDVTAQLSQTTTYAAYGTAVVPTTGIAAIADEALTAGNIVVVYPVAGVLHMRKFLLGFGSVVGWVGAGVTSGASGTAIFAGNNTATVAEFSQAAGNIVYPAVDSGAAGKTALGKTGFVAPGWTGSAIPQFTATGATSTYTDGTTSGLSVVSTYNRLAILSERYNSRLDTVLMTAGISPLGKGDADILESGDGCWQDYPGEQYYWVVTGEKGTYAPAFNNKPYWSSVKGTNLEYHSTKEFAFQINVACPANLLPGDQIPMTINGSASAGGTYQPGDVLTEGMVAAAPLFLAGGQTGNTLETWGVSGSQTGAMPSFVYDSASPTDYSQTLLGFRLQPGGIPFAKGDKFVFNVEGGHYQWRKNGGSWSADIAIPSTPTLLDDGLSIAFTTGTAPSFVMGDQYHFTALQPWAASNMLSPNPGARWAWGADASPSIVFALPVPTDIGGAAIGMHTLPAGTTITLEGGTISGTYDWSETLTWRAGAFHDIFAAVKPGQNYLRLTLGSAANGTISWFWAGVPLETEFSASMDLRNAWNLERASSGLYSSARMLGRTINGDVTWTNGGLTEQDGLNIIDMLDWLKSHDDEPLIFIPNLNRPDALIAQVNVDEAKLPDINDYGTGPDVPRMLGGSLPLKGVWQ